MTFLKKIGSGLFAFLAGSGALLALVGFIFRQGEKNAENKREKAFNKKREENIGKQKEVDKKYEKMDDINDAISDFTS